MQIGARTAQGTFGAVLGSLLVSCAPPAPPPARPSTSPVQSAMLETEPSFRAPVLAAADTKGAVKRACAAPDSQACASCGSGPVPVLRQGNFVSEGDALVGLQGCGIAGAARTLRWNAATDELQEVPRVELAGCEQLHFPGRDLLLCPEQVKDSRDMVVVQTYVLDLCADRKDLLLEIVDSSLSACRPEFQGPVRAIRPGGWQSAGNAVFWTFDVHETTAAKDWYASECSKRGTWESEEGYLATAIATSRPASLAFVLRDGRLVPTEQTRALATSLGGTARSVQLRSLAECRSVLVSAAR